MDLLPFFFMATVYPLLPAATIQMTHALAHVTGLFCASLKKLFAANYGQAQQA